MNAMTPDEEGFHAAQRTGPYAAEDADVRCPYVTETPDEEAWLRGFEDGKKAADKARS